MSTSTESHEERTAHEPRRASRHTVVLADIVPVGRLVRVLRLRIPAGEPDIEFLPGQWVDTFVPGVAKAGGFTITSTPSRARSGACDGNNSTSTDRYIELAVKASPDNPAAAWLWQEPPSAILGRALVVRVGGSFVFPPRRVSAASIVSDCAARVVFVAGGVGVNPLVSMASHLAELAELAGLTGLTGLTEKHATATAAAAADRATSRVGPEVVFLYATRAEETPGDSSRDIDYDTNAPGLAHRILFLPRLAAMFGRRGPLRGQLRLFLTGGPSGCVGDGASDDNGDGNGVLRCCGETVPCVRRRITADDLATAVRGGSHDGDGDNDSNGSGRRSDVFVYVCGVPAMTDAFVSYLTDKDVGLGLASGQVLFEKWW